MELSDTKFFAESVIGFMTSNPITINPSMKLNVAENLMNDKKINLLIVAEGQRPVGVVQIYDIQ